MENLHAKHVHLFLCLNSRLLGFFECCFCCNNSGMWGFVTLCLFALFGLVWSGLAGSNYLLGSIILPYS